jgi:hypothetical protein
MRRLSAVHVPGSATASEAVSGLAHEESGGQLAAPMVGRFDDRTVCEWLPDPRCRARENCVLSTQPFRKLSDSPRAGEQTRTDDSGERENDHEE